MANAKKIPEVSVILTSYNHGAYVAAAIESALNQTFADFELLIIDDGSKDDSREIIKRFDDPRIKTFLYTENRGPVLAIRDAVNFARGKYIAVHHSDDLWALDKLEKQVAFLDANPNYAACFTLVEFVDERGNVCELVDLGRKDLLHLFISESAPLIRILVGHLVSLPVPVVQYRHTPGIFSVFCLDIPNDRMC